MTGHAQLKFVMTECSKTQIRLTGPNYTGLLLLISKILQIVTGVGAYIGHELAVQHFKKHFPADRRTEARILDVGAGTGMVARGVS